MTKLNPDASRLSGPPDPFPTGHPGDCALPSLPAVVWDLSPSTNICAPAPGPVRSSPSASWCQQLEDQETKKEHYVRSTPLVVCTLEEAVDLCAL
uniref:Uncharacterized protein n=1 Tax=Plectus sambesii TaxID=2011161 RepID=A0A914W8H6_9BILA